MATIVERANGRYQAKVRRLGLPPLSRTFDRKGDAEKWARSEETNHDRGVWRDQSLAETTTFFALLEQYERDVVPSKRGAEVEKLRIATIKRDKISQYKLASFSPLVLAQWRDKRLEAGAAGSTINRELNLISAVCNWARKELMIPFENPIAAIRRPPGGHARDRRLVDDEETRLLDALASRAEKTKGTKRSGAYQVGSRNKWLKPIVQLAIETAMRQGELLELRWELIDLEAQTAHLPVTKNGEPRTVPLSTKAVAVLRALKGKSEEGVVFPITSEAVKRSWMRACKRARIENLHFHDLRHEATSRLAEKLPNLIELAAVTGHKDLRMLKRYYHPRACELAKKLG